MSKAEIREMRPEEEDHWARMRAELFRISFDEAKEETADFMAGEHLTLKIVFVGVVDGDVCAFLEISERIYADGCYDGPVAYMEGWFVGDKARGMGVGKALVDAAIAWAKSKNYPHLASDAELTNIDGHRAHEAVGFEEVDRVVQYRMALK
jgi:aminoglycoside 6'-N-acetyltransferase I